MLTTVRAKAILSRRKGIQESGCVEEYEVFVEAVCEGAVPPKRINAEGSDSILADLDVPKSFMSPEAPRIYSRCLHTLWFTVHGAVSLDKQKCLK